MREIRRRRMDGPVPGVPVSRGERQGRWGSVEVLTDERLDDLAERFIAGHVREITGVSFGQFMGCPDEWETHAEVILACSGLHRNDLQEYPRALKAAGGWLRNWAPQGENRLTYRLTEVRND